VKGSFEVVVEVEGLVPSPDPSEGKPATSAGAEDSAGDARVESSGVSARTNVARHF
jgi:hypothetical protein